ncbi:winged helix-turn-helix transcriptional regulator [Propionibacterium freudenreichii]|nr:winged helix-turn-helix transcriptional regulator [Propionibacterium freudenreichii]
MLRCTHRSPEGAVVPAGIRPQSLGELLGKLEESGQIARHPDPDDRRAQVVEITARGRAADSDRPAAPGDPFAVLDPDQQREFVTCSTR